MGHISVGSYILLGLMIWSDHDSYVPCPSKSLIITHQRLIILCNPQISGDNGDPSKFLRLQCFSASVQGVRGEAHTAPRPSTASFLLGVKSLSINCCISPLICTPLSLHSNPVTSESHLSLCFRTLVSCEF